MSMRKRRRAMFAAARRRGLMVDVYFAVPPAQVERIMNDLFG